MQSHRVTPAVGLVACLLATAPAAAADPPPDADDIDTYPVAQGRFTTPTDFYWVYFRTPDGRSWDRTERRAGRLDTVPLDAPAETKQTVVNSWGPAEYRGFEHHDVHS